jgi:hypothetical protein
MNADTKVQEASSIIVKKQDDSKVQHQRQIDELKQNFEREIHVIKIQNQREIMALLTDSKS